MRDRRDWGGSRSQGSGGRGSNPPPDNRTLEQIWPHYLEDGYFDDAGNLRPEYVSRSKVDGLARAMADARLTASQVRRYFQHCRAIEARLRGGQTRWESLAADFKKLDIAAADALCKSQSKIPKLFHDFIRKNVEAVKDEKCFLEGFLPHFEAVVGFGACHFQAGRS